MTRQMRNPILALLAAATLAACNGDEGAPLAPGAAGLSELEAEAVALELEVSSADAVDGAIAEGELGFTAQSVDFIASMPPMSGSGTDEVTFTRTRSCELGGEVVVDGTLVREWVAETRHVTIDVAATKTHVACTFTVGAGAGAESEITITLDGNPNVAITAHREREMGYFVGLQTMSHAGSVAWTKSDGTSGTCDIDIQAVLDPEAGTRTVTGTACGRTIDRTWTWNRRFHGPVDGQG